MSEQTYHYTEIFVPTLWTKKREVIVGRDEAFKGLSNTVKTPGAHAIIFGPRGAGKTTLRDHFGASLGKDGFGVITLLGSPGLTQSGIVKRALGKLGYTHGPLNTETKKSGSLKLLGIGGDVHQTERFENRTLNPHDADEVAEQLAALAPEKGLVVIIDEFDVIPNTSDEDAVQVHLPHLLRACSHVEGGNRVHFVIVGAAYSGDAMLRGHLSLARSLTEIRLSRLTQKQVRDFFKLGFSLAGFSYDSAVIDYLTKCSAGYPYTLHYLGALACELAEARPSRTISCELMRSVLPMAKNNYSRKSRLSYRGRSEAEIETLLRMTYAWRDGSTSDNIMSETKFGAELTDKTVSQCLKKLVKEGVLVTPKDANAYVFSDPYVRVKVMIDRESSMIQKHKDYPAGAQIEMPF